jgi:hypothetical protein
MAGRARKLGWASTLVRCKMGEIEEQVAKEGFPAIMGEGEDNCCKDAEIQGFTCKWQIEQVVMPDTMFNPEDGEEGEGSGDDKDKSKDSKSTDSKSGDSKDSKSGGKDSSDTGEKKKKLDPAELFKDPKKLLGGGSTPSGAAMGMGAAAMGMGTGTGTGDDESAAPDMDSIASMAMGYIYPILKPSFESQIRRATVTVMWKEGDSEQQFDVTQYLVAEQPIPLQSTDPNAQNQNGTGTGTGTNTGTGTGTGTNSGRGLFGTTPQGNLFQPRTNFGGP